MSTTTEVIASYKTNNQNPLDAKGWAATLSELKSLGIDSYKAFQYYEGLEIRCAEDNNVYIWRREVVEGEPNGLIEIGGSPSSYTYPGAIGSKTVYVNGIDYSGLTFNLFPEVAVKPSPDIDIEDDRKLKFADRAAVVNSQTSEVQSLGYKYIKDTFDFTSIPTGYDNSIWEIRDAFDLSEAGTITLPENTTLRFNGGRLLNATIVGNRTRVEGAFSQIFDQNATLTGTWDLLEVYPEWFGAKKDGSDDYLAIQKAIDFAKDKYTVKFNSGQYTYGTTLQVNHRNCKLLGDEGDRSVDGGTRLNFTGTIAAIQIGNETAGRDWRDIYYDGYGGFNFEKINLRYGGNILTPMLLRGDLTTATNVDGIVDWYGGSIIMNDVIIEKFTNNFKGIQSDVNTFNNVTSLYSRYGFYLSPRSDQNTFNDFYTFYCDSTITLDGCSNTRINSIQVVNCGAVGQAYAIDIRKGTFSIDINDAWFESYTGGGDGKSYVGIGVNDGYNGVDGSNQPIFTRDDEAKDIVFASPYMQGGAIGSDSSCPYLCDVGKATSVVVRDPSHSTSGLTGVFTSLVNFVGNYTKNTSSAFIQCSYDFNNRLFSDNTTSNDFAISYNVYGPDVNQISNRISRFDFRRTSQDGVDNTLRDFRLSAPVNRTLKISFPYDGTTGNVDLITFTRRITHVGSIPTTGTWEKGDLAINNNPSIFQQSSGRRYIIYGWSCNVAGTPGTWEKLLIYLDEGNETPIYTAIELADISSEANTSKKGFGTRVWDSTNNKPVFSGGETSASVWRNSDGTVAHTPV